MEKLVGDRFQNVSWDEYADHSLTGDDVQPVVKESRFASDGWWVHCADMPVAS